MRALVIVAAFSFLWWKALAGRYKRERERERERGRTWTKSVACMGPLLGRKKKTTTSFT